MSKIILIHETFYYLEESIYSLKIEVITELNKTYTIKYTFNHIINYIYNITYIPNYILDTIKLIYLTSDDINNPNRIFNELSQLFNQNIIYITKMKINKLKSELINTETQIIYAQTELINTEIQITQLESEIIKTEIELENIKKKLN